MAHPLLLWYIATPISMLFCLGFITMITFGSLCIQGNDMLCGPGGYSGGIAMIVLGALLLPGQVYHVVYTIIWLHAVHASGYLDDPQTEVTDIPGETPEAVTDKANATNPEVSYPESNGP